MVYDSDSFLAFLFFLGIGLLEREKREKREKREIGAIDPSIHWFIRVLS
jgi:hypothetical protein